MSETKKYNLFCIKDCKVGFWKPFVSPNEACAIREFSALVNNSSDINIRTVVRDLDLYRLGSFDDNTGDIISDVSFICNSVGIMEVKSDVQE